MDPTKYLGRDIVSALEDIRAKEAVFEYGKVDGDEFLNITEKGFYLHSKNGNGIIFDCRIYLIKKDGYLSAENNVLGEFSSTRTVHDMEDMLGQSIRPIKSIRIPSRPPTLQGKEFIYGKYIIKAFFDGTGVINYFHISQSEFT